MASARPRPQWMPNGRLSMFVVLVIFTAVRIPVAVAARPNYEPPLHVVGATLESARLDQLYRSGGWEVGIRLIDPQGEAVLTCSGSQCERDRVSIDYQPGD